MPPPAVEATGLTKTYGGVRVLDALDLHVAPGAVFALLGPNGAGKTTTVRILATLTTPDGGHARVAGHDVVSARSRVRRAISLTGQFAAVDETQTGAENLWTAARLSGLSRPAAARRAAELLERFGLAEAGDRLTRTYSGGMRRRLDLAAGLVRDPGATRVMFLDEPTTGLDPRSRQELWEVVRELSASGTTVFLTTQYLEEADRLADRIAVLGSGRTLAEGTPAELKARYAAHRLDVVADDQESYLRLAARTGRPTTHDPATRTLGVPTDGSALHVRGLLDALDPERRDIARFTLHMATLDDVFLTLTAADDNSNSNGGSSKEPSHA
ncbi:ATP-binding cassette domain-containing protein [Streptomyces sp. WAC01280]|uniref:ABC transporter ATP-binding protein n=1 Tax=Streptomyces sp. WAC01280 TaxID=2487424 RepID=UPI000F7700C3|nr:ATP-binding cassette domain-containing protein [Streptomyces sp. WAC01280]RSS50277.1 ATP-binding cassette domain-containing protein [Streptomyces sp. WAC01280]